jgi:tetratricopeptide (TPR) repeat protein
LKLQRTSPHLNSYENRSLYTTWQITFDRIEQQNAASAKLFKLWAYFNRQDLWFELLRHTNSADDEWIQKLTEDELNFNEAVTLLCSFGLVNADRSLQQQFGFGGYSVHSCVHSWTVFVLNNKWDKGLARLALTCVASEVPSTDEKDWWLLQRRLLQHVTRQDLFIADDKVDIDGLDWAFHNLGNLYKDQGKLAEAEKMYIRALQGKEEVLGPDHTSTLDTVNNLGTLYKKQSKLAEAEKMYIRALQGNEEALGPDHTSTLLTVNNLGTLYKNQGKLAEAEKMYIRALQGNEEALGPDHTSTLDTVNNLGILYADQGKLAEAEKMYIRALQGCEEALGPDHTSTLDTVNNLGILYADQGKLAEAEKMYIRALQGCEEALGPDHTSTLDTVNNLSILYKNQGKLAEAEKMYIRALQGYKKAVGADNIMTFIPALNTTFNLGSLFEHRLDIVNARMMYSKALIGYEKVGGPNHPMSQRTQSKLQALDTTTREADEGVDNSQGESSRRGAEKTPSKSRRPRLLKKLGFR